MEFLRNKVISFIYNWATIENMNKLLNYSIGVCIIFAILKLTGVVNWSWETVIYPFYINCISVVILGFEIIPKGLERRILELSDAIDSRYNNLK